MQQSVSTYAIESNFTLYIRTLQTNSSESEHRARKDAHLHFRCNHRCIYQNRCKDSNKTKDAVKAAAIDCKLSPLQKVDKLQRGVHTTTVRSSSGIDSP